MATKKFRISNKAIVLMKLISALGLFFSCCLFFFLNLGIFRRDLGFDPDYPLGSDANPWYNLVFLIVFLLAICFIVYYITNMVIRFETKQIWKADRLFIVYQIVFTALLIITIWRWFFISISNAMVPSVIMVLAGFINLITPRIVDNNNRDF